MNDNIGFKEKNERHSMFHKMRNVDLNLLSVFNTVVQEKSVTRAAEILGISQPAVSNALSRLKEIFGEELFVRVGRGVKPTERAYQISQSFHRALQLVYDELPGVTFRPETSNLIFNISISSPLDKLLLPLFSNAISKYSPGIKMKFNSFQNQQNRNQSYYRENFFFLDYEKITEPGVVNLPLFNDNMVLVSRANHPRAMKGMSEKQIYQEEHAIVSLERASSFSAPWYSKTNQHTCISFQGNEMVSVLSAVSRTDMVAIAPYWLANEFEDNFDLQLFPLPLDPNFRVCYLSWLEASICDKADRWMVEFIIKTCRELNEQFIL